MLTEKAKNAKRKCDEKYRKRQDVKKEERAKKYTKKYKEKNTERIKNYLDNLNPFN